MRILILTQYYPPEPIPKPHELARGLRERGHEVLVVTGFPNYPKGIFYPDTRLRLWKWDSVDGIRVLRLPLYPDHSRSAVRRVLNYGSFAFMVAVVGAIGCGRADVMFVEHPPLTIGLAAWLLGRARGIRYLYQVNDLWPESVEATGMLKNRRLLNGIARLERFVYRRAHAISVISDGMKANLIGKGVPREKVHVIHHWADEAVYQPVPPSRELEARLGLAGRFNVVFAGQLGLAQALDTVLDAAAVVADLPDVQFVFVGDGTDATRLAEETDRRGLTNVRFLGRQPSDAMPSLFALADVLLVHLRDEPLFRITIPSKTMAYMACGRPVLMAVGGDAAAVIRSAGAGLTCPPENPTAMADAVRRLHSLPRAERDAMGQRGRDAFLARYNRKVLLDRYEQILRAVGRGSASAKEQSCVS